VYSIQPLRLADIQPVYQLEQEIFPQDAYPYLDLAFLLATPGMVNVKAVNPANEFMGFIAVADVWLPWRPAWIITLGVAKRFQNQGLGHTLLLESEKWLRARRIRLTVRRGNAPAIHLYQKVGYTTLTIHRGYYRDGEDGLVMEKIL
jgi:ribosomal-protein-alanine N-acetyltransferase